MIALLDPALFVWGAPDRELSASEEATFTGALALALQAVREQGARILPIGGYWDSLWRDFVQPLRKRLRTHAARTVIDELRKKAGLPARLPTAPAATRVWGFRTMFGHAAIMPSPWVDIMATAATQAIASGESVMLLVRLLPTRNLTIHAGKQHVVIHEVTRWRLYVRTPGAAAHTPIDCVRSPAQIRRPWTIRYDERLPTNKDGARYAFCLPDDWHRGHTIAVRTREATPAWIDAAGRAWTRPNIPGGAGHHWDVFLAAQKEIASIGADQVNIVGYGGLATEGVPGSLHHTPTDKQSRVKDMGWDCPR